MEFVCWKAIKSGNVSKVMPRMSKLNIIVKYVWVMDICDLKLRQNLTNK